jgi:elongation factor 1-beta
MAKAVVSMKIMPESPEVDMEALEKSCLEKIKDFAGETETKVEIEPIAFGLKALNIKFVMEEAQGSTEPVENSISGLEDVASAEVTDVRRAIQ